MKVGLGSGSNNLIELIVLRITLKCEGEKRKLVPSIWKF
jgi:hypothetical protein